MPTYKIEGGVTKLGNFLYSYEFTTNAGTTKVNFTSATTPQIGDKIVDGVLVPKSGPIINSDTSRWEYHRPNEWGRPD